MNNPNFEKDVKAVNDIIFKHLEGIKCGELLATKLFYERKNVSFIWVLKNLAVVFLRSHILLETKKDGNIAFFFTPSYAGRMDHFDAFKAVTECSGNSIVFNGNSQKNSFSFKRIIGLLYWIIWIFNMLKSKFSIIWCMYLCNDILQAYYVLEELKDYKLDMEKVKLAVTLCDVHPCDYLITQYFNKLGIKTATLQHAVFYHKTQWYCYRFSHSDYFLANNEYCKNEALKSGFKGEVKVVGHMKSTYFDTYNVNKENEKTAKNTFGLALCGHAFKEQNKALFDYAVYLQKKYNLNVILRFHPTLSKEEYIEAIKKLVKFEFSNEPVNEFASKCDFVILGATNMFAELISFDIPTFRIITDETADIYDGIEDFKFENVEELNKLVRLISNKNELSTRLRKIKSYLCPEGNIRELYKQTLKEIAKQ